jgi:hypothetical protein
MHISEVFSDRNLKETVDSRARLKARRMQVAISSLRSE